MKIAIETYQIIPESSGGIVAQLHNLLSRAFVLYPAVDFRVFATPRSYRPAEPLPPNVKVIILPEATFWAELDLALLRGQADILFRTYPGEERVIFPPSRQIGLIPDLQHEVLPELFSPAVLEARRRSFPPLINNAAALCVYSEHSKQILHKHYPNSPAEIVIVPPGANLQLLQTVVTLTSVETALIPKTPFFLYPANLWPHKNHRRLLAALELALKRLPENISLVLTGDLTGWAELQAQYPRLPVRHLGFVSPVVLQALYRQALALTYFSLYEGFGMPLMEAFALGTPVLCSNLPVLEEIGRPAILSGDPTDPEAIAGLLVRISSEAALREHLKTAGYRQAQLFNGDESSRNFVEACRRLTDRPLEYPARLPLLETVLTKLADLQQQTVAKEHVIGELTRANQQHLALINNLKSELNEQEAASALQQTTLKASLEQSQAQLKESFAQSQAQLEQSQAQLKERLEDSQVQLEQSRAQLKAKESAIEILDLELQHTVINNTVLQGQLKQIQAEKKTLTAALEVAQREATGGDPAVIIGVLDNPVQGVIWTDWVTIQGWAHSTAGRISQIEAFMDETSLGPVERRYPRPDVGAAYNLPLTTQYGYEAILGLPGSIRPGPHKLRVQVRDDRGNRRDFYQTGTLGSPQPLPPFPAPPARVWSGSKLKTRLVSRVKAKPRQNLKDKLRQQTTNWKNRLFHYHLGILHQHSPRPWLIPAYYSRARPPARPPSISIVTPSYNQAGFLERTMRSVLDQRYPNLEYIVQDGGSKDGSAEILQHYSGQLAYWESARDKGQSNALNRGFRRSTGEIMAYLNSDDLILPGALNYVARYFEKHPKVDVVYGQRVIIDENDREIGRWIVPPHSHDEPIVTDILSWADYIPQETMFWRRRIWEEVGGEIDESFQFAMDWDLILRFRALRARFARLPRFLGAFRVHSTQKSSAQISTLGTKEMNRLRERNLGYLPPEIEIHRHTLPYLHRHVFYHKLYRLGILRY